MSKNRQNLNNFTKIFPFKEKGDSVFLTEARGTVSSRTPFLFLYDRILSYGLYMNAVIDDRDINSTPQLSATGVRKFSK